MTDSTAFEDQIVDAPREAKSVLAINSTIAFVGAFTFTTLLHECGHFVAYAAFGAHPVLYFNQVQADDATVSSTGVIVSALAGPVTSLVQGFVCAAWANRRTSNRAADLFIQWLALFGSINFFGYLMLTPLSSVGDTGKAAALLGFPIWLDWLVALGGIAVLLVLVIRQDARFGGFVRGEPDSRERAQWINAAVFFPVMIGSVVNVVFAFPIPTAISAIYPATSSLTVLAGYAIISKMQRPDVRPSPAAATVAWTWGAVTAGLLVINRLLVRGI